jgi:hypothetical protein
MQVFDLVYSSGTVTELHGIPFSFFRRRNQMSIANLVKRQEGGIRGSDIKNDCKKRIDYQIYNNTGNAYFPRRNAENSMDQGIIPNDSLVLSSRGNLRAP